MPLIQIYCQNRNWDLFKTEVQNLAQNSKKSRSAFTGLWKLVENVWPQIRNGHDDKEISNAEKSGLFYKMLPDRTMTERCLRTELQSWITVNMSESEKKKIDINW